MILSDFGTLVGLFDADFRHRAMAEGDDEGGLLTAKLRQFIRNHVGRQRGSSRMCPPHI